MYNRYIPQPDGSFCRSRVPDPCPPQVPAPPPPPPPCVPEPPCPPPQQKPKPVQPPVHNPPQGQSVGGFLKQLLPKDFDTGDLLIIFLLLLMAGDCKEDQNTALLTLALYFFM